MATASNIIEPEYRVNVYLDTNILFDYVEKRFPLLNKSVDFLANRPFVTLRSSHYVLFEFTENRKICLFWKKADPAESMDYSKVKMKIKKEWKYNNKEYAEFKIDIVKQVNEELDLIKNNLHIDFDEHVLHEGLIYPTNSLCLQTKISKEDCLVMVSCIHPDEDRFLDHCLLLTRDEQYYKAYSENTADADMVFSNYNLNKPKLIRTEELSLGGHCPQYNLYNTQCRGDIENYWVGLILNTLKHTLSDSYVGSTYEFGSSNMAKRCIYFELDGNNKTLRESRGLYFVYNDLTNKVILPVSFDFWNTDKVTLPHTNPDFPKYSFMDDSLDVEILAKLREKGNLVFYYDV